MPLSEDKQKLEEQIKALEFQVGALKKGANALLTRNTFKSTAEAIFRALKELVGASAGYVALLSENRFENELLFLDSGDLRCTVDPQLPMPIRGLRERAYTKGDVVFENNFEKSQHAGLLPDGHVELTNVMFVPLVNENSVVGLLGLANKPGQFTEEDAQKAAVFGEFAAIGLQNAKLEEERNAFETSLLESEDRFKKLYKMMREGVCFYEIVFDTDGKPVNYQYLDMNASFERASGLQKNEVIGRLATEVHKTKHPPYFYEFLKVAQTGRPITFEMYSSFLGRYYVVSVFSPGLNQFICIFNDTTYEKINKEYLATTLNAVGDGVIEVNSDRRIVRMNSMAETLTDWKSSEAVGQNLDNVYHVVEYDTGEKWDLNFNEILDKGQEKGKTGYRFLISKTGSKYIIEERSVPVKREDDSVVGVLIIFRDETEKLMANVSLNESRIRYKELFNTMPSGVAVYEAVDNGEDFIIKEFNPSAESIENIGKDQVIGKRVTQAFPGIGEFGLLEVFRRVWKTGILELFPAKIYKDERVTAVWRENYVYRSPSNEIVAIYQDVTERMASMEALKEREYKYRFLFQNMAQGVFYQKRNFELIDANQSVLDIFGLDLEDFRQNSNDKYRWKMIREDGSEIPTNQYPSIVALRTGKPVKNYMAGAYNFKKKDYVWININAFPQFKKGEDKPFQVFVTVHDISDIKKAEMAVREQQIELDAIYQNAPLMLMLLDGNGNIHRINRAAASVVGKTEAEVVGMRGGDALNCPYAKEAGCWNGPYCHKCAIRRTVDDTFETGKSRYMVPVELSMVIGGNSKIMSFLLSTSRIRIHNQDLVLTSMLDVTNLRTAETALRRLGAAVEQAADAVAITDLNGSIIYTNAAYELITGFNTKEAIGSVPRLFETDQETKTVFADLNADTLSGNRWQGRVENVRKDGMTITADCSIFPVRNQQGRMENFIVFMRDVTLEIQMEERLQQAQKLEAIGALAGGIAHDFNNILYPLVGYAEMLRDDIPVNSPFRPNIEEILHSAVRARELVQQILTFSRQTREKDRPIRLQHIIKETLKLLRASIPKTIQIKQRIDDKCGMVIADPTQIHQIIMNLATNAYHAMEDATGIMELSLEQIRFDAGNGAPEGKLSGSYACLRVTDTGKGMEKNILSKVFDPYFTTKPEGKGTGLGMSIIHGIVKKCGGDIRIKSIPGVGTDVFVYFPVNETVPNDFYDDDDTIILEGNERVLLVDDEKAILDVERVVLERLGYHVTCQNDSSEAADTFKQDPNQFDLVITDMTMPGLTGFQLSKEIKKHRPEIPIIICTGYSEQIDEEKCKAFGIEGFIMKPMVKKELATAIRKVLDGQMAYMQK